jgi:hypothetical protein
MTDEDDYDNNTNDGSGDNDIINGGGSGNSNGESVCCYLAIVAVLPKAESMKQDGKSRHTFLLD